MFVLFAVAGLVLLLVLPSLADADGGPIVSDPKLWAMIDEGQQLAVVHLQQDGTCQVDLFVSMVDRSGQSHEMTFFLPLGVQASDFEVVEEPSNSFLEALTDPIDKQLILDIRREAVYQGHVRAALFLGALPTHAAWISLYAVLPLLQDLMWSNAGIDWVPVATLKTPSSQVAVYDINAETDLQALIETSGLDPKVKETLTTLQGQQIAMVKLQTQPVGGKRHQPGIHLSWRSTLIPDPAGATYSYPLGTGKAWGSPIELTRVYVVSPPELGFTVDYPQLGDDLSGRGGRYGSFWKIDDAKSPAFAVDEAYGEFGHIWRATYVKSNSGQDLVVTSLPGASHEMQQAIRRARVEGVIKPLTWLLAPLVGLAVWVTSWHVVMRRRLGVPYRWLQGKLYRDALLWAVLYAVTSLVALPVVCVVVLVLLGLTNAWLFSRLRAEKLQVTRGRAFGAYMLAVLMANVLYLTFAAAYSAIVGAI
jgi:hypothetical protein